MFGTVPVLWAGIVFCLIPDVCGKLREGGVFLGISPLSDTSALIRRSFLSLKVFSRISLSDMATALDMAKLPLNFLPKLAGVIAGYLISVQAVKGVYVRVFGEWI